MPDFFYLTYSLTSIIPSEYGYHVFSPGALPQKMDNFYFIFFGCGGYLSFTRK